MYINFMPKCPSRFLFTFLSSDIHCALMHMCGRRIQSGKMIFCRPRKEHPKLYIADILNTIGKLFVPCFSTSRWTMFHVLLAGRRWGLRMLKWLKMCNAHSYGEHFANYSHLFGHDQRRQLFAVESLHANLHSMKIKLDYQLRYEVANTLFCFRLKACSHLELYIALKMMFLATWGTYGTRKSHS